MALTGIWQEDDSRRGPNITPELQMEQHPVDAQYVVPVPTVTRVMYKSLYQVTLCMLERRFRTAE